MIYDRVYFVSAFLMITETYKRVFLQIVPAMNQVECHPYLNQTKLIEFCKQHGILLTGYSPLGSPGVFGEIAPGPKPLLKNDTVLDIAKRNNKSPAQILLRWQVIFIV